MANVSRMDLRASLITRNATTRKLASEVGFCVDDRLADPLAESVMHKIRHHGQECESRVNHLFRGRETFALSRIDRIDLEKFAERCEYMAKTAREILEAQEPVKHMQAAE